MKLFVWNDKVLKDYGYGLALAVAEDEQTARQLIIDRITQDKLEFGLDMGCILDQINDDGNLYKPADEVHDLDESVSFYCWGSS